MELTNEQLHELLREAATLGAKIALEQQSKPIGPGQWLTPAETMAMLGVSRTNLWRYETRGMLTHNGHHGTQLKRFSLESINQILANKNGGNGKR